MKSMRRIVLPVGIISGLVVATSIGSTVASVAWAVPITITEVAGFPNGRTSNDPPSNAIDHDTETYTWTTEAFNLGNPSHLAIGFSTSEKVNRLRLWKENWGGGGENVKNLKIQYTTDTGPLKTRSWKNVCGLKNGFKGSELLHATKVSRNGNVIGDVHNSNDYQAKNPTLVSGPPHLALIPGGGWASLTFRTVNATGLRISFSSYKNNPYNPSLYCEDSNFCWHHYRVGEFEAHYEEIPQ